MQNYVVIGLMMIFGIKPCDKLINNSICIMLLSNMCMISIREEIIPNIPFHSSGPLLVILEIFTNVDFGDTREVSLIGP